MPSACANPLPKEVASTNDSDLDLSILVVQHREARDPNVEQEGARAARAVPDQSTSAVAKYSANKHHFLHEPRVSAWHR